MESSKQRSMSTAFLIGKTGLVEWIGNPMSMNDPLKQVVEGSWDRAAFVEEYDQRQYESLCQEELFTLMRSGDLEAIEARLDEFSSSDNPGLQQFSAHIKPIIRDQWFCIAASNNPDKSIEQLPHVLESLADDPVAVGQLAHQVYQADRFGLIDSPKVLQQVTDAAEAVVENTDQQSSLLNTIARLHSARGDLQRAIAFQRRAVAAAKSPKDGTLQSSAQEYLDELLAQQQAGD